MIFSAVAIYFFFFSKKLTSTEPFLTNRCFNTKEQNKKVMDTTEKKNDKAQLAKEREKNDVLNATTDMRVEYKVDKNDRTKKVNKLWLILGVMILVFILLWILYAMGFFEVATK